MTAYKQGWEDLANTRGGVEPNYTKCGQRMFGNWHAYQCGNSAKYDPNDEGMPTRCGVHCKSIIEKRRERERVKAEEKRERSEALRKERLLRKPEIQALISIAKGHNDPRYLAMVTLDNLGLSKK